MTMYLRERLQRQIWRAWGEGLSITRIARRLPTRHISVHKLISAHGGICPPPRRRSGRSLSAKERELIGQALAAGCSLRAIAAGLGRSPSTISRELRRNGGPMRYSGLKADERAWRQARRPKPCLLVQHQELRALVIQKLSIDWSPEQISGWLPKAYPHDPTMRVSHETIYRSLFIQARGVLKGQLSAHLRRGQRLRIPHAARQLSGARSTIVDGIHISQRPAEAQDRAIPGHWEGDLLCGGTDSQIATLVERQSRFVMLVKVPSKTASQVAQALGQHVQELPLQLRRSLTWDRGIEMARHKDFTLATQMQVYFCDPHSPWQRGTNENTNGLLRQYLPKGANLSGWSQQQLNEIAMRLNQRPRKTLDFATPAEVLRSSVALTG
jgi:IS30 family transposase